jgi:hypothetical protein
VRKGPQLTCVVLCCVVLCCVVLCCVVLCCAVLCCAVLCCGWTAFGCGFGVVVTEHRCAGGGLG